MGFLSATSLLWLLALGPAIVLLYLLKLKRKELRVASTLLWEQVLKDVQANAPFQKLKTNLLLFLQLLVVLLAILALARPFVLTSGLRGARMVAILDGSASMRATDLSGTRFEAAKQAALKLVDGMRPEDRMMVLLAAKGTAVACPFTDDKAALRAAIGKLEPTDTVADIRQAIVLALSLMNPRQSGTMIAVISDGAYGPIENLNYGKANMRFVRIGNGCDNVGITALDVRKGFTKAYDYQIFTSVHNYSKEPRTCALEYNRNETLIDAKEITIPAGGDVSDVLQGKGGAAGMISAQIDIKDDLAADNQAYAFINPRRQLNVLLVTKGAMFLEKALNVSDQIQLSKVSPSGYTSPRGYDVVIFDNWAPEHVPPGNYLFINAACPETGVEVTSQVAGASVLDWSRTHPLTRFVDFTNLRLTKALTIKSSGWAQSVAESEEGPLIVAGERRGLRSIFLGFGLDIADSQLPVRVAFPIFISNCLDWLGGQAEAGESLQMRTGEVVSISVNRDLKEIGIVKPGGRRETLAVESNPVYYRGADLAGLYQVEGKHFKRVFAANLLNLDESNIQPRDSIRFGEQEVASGNRGPRSQNEIWRWIVLLALAAVAYEWYAYHRRV